MRQLRHFLVELDRAWRPLGADRQPLHIIGSGALMLLRTATISEPVEAQLLSLVRYFAKRA